MFTDTGNDGDVLACISSVQKARMKVDELTQEKLNKHTLSGHSAQRSAASERLIKCGSIDITFQSQRLSITKHY